MKASEIKELIELVSRSEFAEFELERDGFKLKLTRAVAGADAVTAAPAVAASVAPPAVVDDGQAAPASTAVDPSLHVVSSPIVGTFYAAVSPDAPPFVAVGDRVTRGQTLCIVEAMKVMNEIESDADGELVEIAAENGQPVEFGDALFTIRTA